MGKFDLERGVLTTGITTIWVKVQFSACYDRGNRGV